MLDPRTIRALAARPSENGVDLNVALAQEGDAHALAALLGARNLDPLVLEAITQRVLRGPPIEAGGPDEEPPRLEIPWEPREEPRSGRPWTLHRALLAAVVRHPRVPAGALAAILEAHGDEPGFVAAAATAPSATLVMVERLALAPSSSPLHERPWLDLLEARADVRALAEGWCAREEELLREAAARLLDTPVRLAPLASDPKRRVRRAVARNAAAGALRSEMARRDPAVEVRASAASSARQRDTGAAAARALARAARAMERGGDADELTTDAIVEHAHELDPELAWLAGLVLDLEALSSVARSLAEHDATQPASRALVAAAMVRPADRTAGGALESAARAELAGLLARAIARSYAPHRVAPQAAHRSTGAHAAGLTGQARLVAFVSELLADADLVTESALVDGLARGALVADPALANRWIRTRADRAPGLVGRLSEGLVRAAASGGRPPACALEAAWRDSNVSASELLKLARVVRARRDADAHLRGGVDGTRAPHVDLDVDASLRPIGELERIIESLDPWVRTSARTALVFLASTPRALAVGGREVRGWHDGVLVSQLHRILRAARGAGEVAARVSRVDTHADEAGLAVALLARGTSGAEVAKLLAHNVRLADGLVLAAGVEALWALGQRDDVHLLVDALAARRRRDPAALAAWLVVGEIDRARTPTVLAGALDEPIANAIAGPLPGVYAALTLLERRHPGTLERLRPSTRGGQAAVVNALARAYPGLVGSQ